MPWPPPVFARSVAAALAAAGLIACEHAPPQRVELSFVAVASTRPRVSLPFRPLAPLSGGLVTTGNVAFRWWPPEEGKVVLARDRAFSVAQQHPAAAGEATVRGLAEGRWFWRVVGENGRSTAVWTLRIAHPGADTVEQAKIVKQGLVADTDVDGNGRADIVFRQSVFLGGVPAGEPVALATAGLIPCKRAWGAMRTGNRCGNLRDAESVGDVNGDGFDDLIAFDDEGRALLFAGPPPEKASWEATRRVCLSGPPCRGGEVSCLGDVNGDGYADIAVGTVIYGGGPRGLGENPLTTLPAAAAVAGGGDVDGDGFADVVRLDEHGMLALHRGSLGGPETRTAVELPLGELDLSGHHPPLRVGDLDRDGLADVVAVGSDRAGVPSLSVVLGTEQIAAATVSHVFRWPSRLESDLSWTIDHRAGLSEPARIVLIDRSHHHQEMLTLLFDPREGFRLEPISRVYGGNTQSRRVLAPGDVDGDGVDDIAQWGLFDGYEEPAVCLFRGAPGPFDVLGPAESFCWYHTGPDAAVPVLETLTAKQRRDDDASDRRLRMETYGALD